MTIKSTQLEQLRKWRTRPERDISLGASIVELRKSLKKTNKQLNTILEVWDEVLPEHLNQNATPTSLRSGTLFVTVSDSSTAYQLNRLVRASLLRELQKRSSRTLKQIKIKVAN
ncbi:MAG: DUF721 domain-containing protein [Phycisphaerales bacterium]|nr:DUF721 domain-containing protein [Phycisphaerales bacterium]